MIKCNWCPDRAIYLIGKTYLCKHCAISIEANRQVLGTTKVIRL